MKIKILASDIKTAEFCDIFDCPIARAFKRVVGDIDASVGPDVIHTYISNVKDKTYKIPKELQMKFEKMVASVDPCGWEAFIERNGTLEPEDFEIELIEEQ